jgi:hypothetical protein
MPAKKKNRTWIVFAVILVLILGVVWVGLSKRTVKNNKYEAKGKTVARPNLSPLPADFDWKSYVANYDDLRKAGIKTEEAAKQHWREIGAREGRSYQNTRKPVADVAEALPSDFSWRNYVDNYKDLQEMGIDTKEKATEHWLKIGSKEGRKYKDDPIVVAEIPYMPWKKD